MYRKKNKLNLEIKMQPNGQMNKMNNQISIWNKKYNKNRLIKTI